MKQAVAVAKQPAMSELLTIREAAAYVASPNGFFVTGYPTKTVDSSRLDAPSDKRAQVRQENFTDGR